MAASARSRRISANQRGPGVIPGCWHKSCSEEFTFRADVWATQRHGSHPRHSPGHMPGLPICEVRHAKRPQRRAPRPLVHRSGRRARAPSCALKIQRGRASTYFNNLTPNCVTITEPVSDRKEQKFSVRRSARIAHQDSRFGCRQFPAQAFHDQSVDLLKELLRDSDVYLALQVDGLRELDNVGFPCRHYPTCSAASPWIRGTSLN